MSFYADEFLSAKPGEFEKKEFNIGADQSLETEVSESLNAFGIRGKVVGSEVGPYITRVYFKLDRGVRFNSIEPLTEDLKMTLRAPSIKIMPEPEKGAVAIEIPNAERIKIPFGNVFYSDYGNMVLPASLGVDPKGKPVYLDIADTPHLLIAGTTGAGKSVCLNTIITSLMLNCRPTDLQFLLIDPKGNEFVQYEGVKSLISGEIIDDVETALDSLKWLVQEMERRYKILKNCRCRSIDEYRQRRNFGRIEGSLKYYIENLPYIVVVIDEYADLMMKSANALQENVKKIGQKARAAGIHLILATQRPSAKTIDGDIKANVPTRIALKVSSITDSKTILDYGGAERLLGRGDMFLKRQELQDPQRVHGCYISNEEIKKAIELLPQKKLYRVNEENVFANDIHNFYNVSTPEYLKAHAIWGELNAVSKIIMENFSEFMAGRHDEIYQVCASQLGMEKSRVDVVFSDVNNAINDSEFYQILLRLCSEHNKKCDCPFVKAVIYSSSLRLKNRIECDLFLDYIFEHVSEDDSWADFVFNNCDLNEKLIQRMAERGDDRAIECICDWDVYSLSDSVKETIFQLAVQDKDVAVEKVAIWSSCYKLHERFGELSESGQNKALEILCRNARYYGCFDYAACIIFDLAKEGNERACECIDDNYDVFEERVIEFVDNQNFSDVKEFAKKIHLFAHIEGSINAYAGFVCNMADEGDAWAKEKIYVVDSCFFQEYIMRKADEADDDAWSCIRLHYDENGCSEFYDYVKSCARDTCAEEKVRSLARELVFDCWYDFIDVILELACDGDESAKCAIYGAFESHVGKFDEFNKFVLNDAQDGYSKGQNLVCKNPQIRLYQRYILDEAKLGDDDAIDAIYEHPEKEYFHEFKDCPDFILTRAKVGDEYAKNVVYSRPENTEFQKYIVKKARQGNSRAKSVVLNNFWMGLFRECICEMAASGDDVAKNVVLANVKYDLFQKCIVELADQGDAEAKKVVQENPEIALFQKSICEMAASGDADAKKVVQENPEIALFQKSICELSISGDKDAKQVVLENPKKVLFQENICKLATLGDEDAKKIVFANAEKDLFRKCIVELALQGNCDAKRVVLANVKYDLFQKCIVELANQGNADAKKVVQENPEIALFQKSIFELATSGDKDAKKVVLENPRIALFQISIREMAISGDEDAKKIVVDNSLIKFFESCISDSLRKNDQNLTKLIREDIDECVTVFKSDLSSHNELVEKIVKGIEENCFSEDKELILSHVDVLAYIFQHVDNPICKKCIMELAPYHQNARTVLLRNSRIKEFQPYILKEAILGSDDAKFFVLHNPEIDVYQQYIVEEALSGNADAQMVVFNNSKIQAFQACLLNGFRSGKMEVKNVVYGMPSITAQLAELGDENAWKIICSKPYDFMKFILQKAEENDAHATFVFEKNFQWFAELVVGNVEREKDNPILCRLLRNSLFASIVDENALKGVPCAKPVQNILKNFQ